MKNDCKKITQCLLNKYLFVKNCKAFLALGGDDLAVEISKDIAQNDKFLIFSCCQSEQDILQRGRKIHSVMDMLEVLKSIENSDWFFIFIFKTELTTIDDISSILDSFFESMDLKTRKDDHYDSKYNCFNFALKTTKILTNDVKIQDFNQKMEIVQKLTKEKTVNLVKNVEKMSERDFHPNKISKLKDIKKTFKMYTQKLKMFKEIINGHTWNNDEDDMDEVLSKISEISLKIQKHPKNPLTLGFEFIKQ